VAIIALTVASLFWAIGSWALGRDNFTMEGIIANGLWGLNNVLAMSIMVRAAFWKPDWQEET
jgi:cellulose synthase (UDP-forming)